MAAAKRNTATVTVENRTTGKEHVIDISAPRTFFGLWRVKQRKPRRSARVRVACGTDGRIKYLWSRGAGDRETQGAMIAAVNRAVAQIGKSDRASFAGICRRFAMD